MRPLKGSPSIPKTLPLTGEKPKHGTFAFGTNTIERAMHDPSPLAKHFTNFKHDFSEPMQIPNVVRGTHWHGMRKKARVGQPMNGELDE